ncbi:aldehyde dehydrogenase family protein [Amycolatopsis sp. PS_44_ISF1]|uniref:aldehyde dehydrogenase family protein n=1 Tax=Amycolatopsis sp. PS_44_ISF1 TaxID=2974917 RepID=UPI0028E07C62|nr:aldehyde dehydrogenase family protein [Amycolatopsis sp. PS_44_ISF1]MDT8915939.1 aldehyde dehydrogenase family protein [Amycolatopsis sp. PS_44_ISF1]
MSEIPEVVSRLRTTFRSGRTKPLEWRRAQLTALKAMLLEQVDDFLAALHADLGKPAAEARSAEITFVVNEVDHTLAHLDEWVAPESAPLPDRLRPGSGTVVREPLGVGLVIGPWNYPLHLVLAPLVGVLAAGNAAVVKPSELSPTVSAAIARHLPAYLDPEAVAVVEGAVPETTELLEQPFDHIFYTGNGTVGRIVMTAAARHLTPVVLELGGKSPVIVDTDVDLRPVAERIVYGKFMNAGQTCVAPDYVLAVGDTAEKLEPLLADVLRAKFGEDPAAGPDYGRIVNTRHFDRLSELLGSGRVVTGGQTDRDTRFIAPTVLADVAPDSPVMGEEIFGPILPVLPVASLDEAIGFVTERPKPLALYAFVGSEEAKQRILNETSSGAVGFGLPVAHLTASDLPFGGVGESGMGRYHGKYSIDTFSNLKAVLDQPLP